MSEDIAAHMMKMAEHWHSLAEAEPRDRRELH
jgi:hypothetical protein